MWGRGIWLHSGSRPYPVPSAAPTRRSPLPPPRRRSGRRLLSHVASSLSLAGRHVSGASPRRRFPTPSPPSPLRLCLPGRRRQPRSSPDAATPPGPLRPSPPPPVLFGRHRLTASPITAATSTPSFSVPPPLLLLWLRPPFLSCCHNCMGCTKQSTR